MHCGSTQINEKLPQIQNTYIYTRVSLFATKSMYITAAHIATMQMAHLKNSGVMRTATKRENIRVHKRH